MLYSCKATLFKVKYLTMDPVLDPVFNNIVRMYFFEFISPLKPSQIFFTKVLQFLFLRFILSKFFICNACRYGNLGNYVSY